MAKANRALRCGLLTEGSSMKKIPCLFQREFQPKGVTILETVQPGCEWVIAGEGVATRKRDGTACMVKDGRLHKRYDAKRNYKTGEYKAIPSGALPCDEPDPVTGHWPHWVPVDASNPADKHHVAAWCAAVGDRGPLLRDGTYELCGPAINGNPEGLSDHMFFRHGAELCWEQHGPNRRTFSSIRNYLLAYRIEGIVYHHPDGRMCKIRRHDFGIQWGSKVFS